MSLYFQELDQARISYKTLTLIEVVFSNGNSFKQFICRTY